MGTAVLGFSKLRHILTVLPLLGAWGCSAVLNNPPLPLTANHASISGTPTIADGIDTSIISIVLVDDGGLPLVGVTPTFEATDTEGTNEYGPCTVSDANGRSSCWMRSMRSEDKVLKITFPQVYVGDTVVFSPAPMSDVAVETEPSYDAIAGVTFTQQPVFKILDPLGNIVPDSPKIISLAGFVDSGCSVPVAAGTFTASTIITTAGYGYFTDVKHTKAGPLYIKASSSGLRDSRCLGPITVVHNVAYKLKVRTQPSATAIAGIPYTQQPVFEVLDFWDNLVDTGPTSTPSVTLSAFGGASCSASTGGGTLRGTNPVTAVAGVATFTDINHTKATGISLKASSGSLQTDCTSVTTISPHDPDVAQSSITGTSPAAANDHHYSYVTVTIKDQYGNPRQGDTVVFGGTGSGNRYQQGPVTNAAGQTNGRFYSTTVETKTLQIVSPIVKNQNTVNFIIPPVSANTTVVASPDPAIVGDANGTTITITLRDASNNPVVGLQPEYTVAPTTANNGGACSFSNASGVSTCSFKTNKAELKTITINQPLPMTDAETVLFKHTVAYKLLYTAIPTAQQIAGVNLTTQPVVQVYDVHSNPVNETAEAVKQVTLSPFTDPGCTIAGSGVSLNAAANPVTSAAGEATFSGVNYTKSGSNVYLKAASPGLVPDCKGFSVLHNTATKLAFSTLPAATSIAGNPLSPYPVVEIQDQYNNRVITGGGAVSNVTIEAHGDSGCSSPQTTFGSTLTNPRSATNGQAGFLDLKYEKKGTFWIKATSPGLTQTCTTSSTVVSPATATASTITGTTNVVADNVATSTITITLKDQYGNTIVGTRPTFSASGTANSYGTCSFSDSNGVSTCTLKSTKAETKQLSIGTPYAVNGGSVTFIAGPPSRLTFTAQGPTSVTAGATFSTIPSVQVQDFYFNPINSATDLITLEAYNSTCTAPGSATLGGAGTSGNANGSTGSLSFPGLNYTKAEGIKLRASAAGLSAGCSNQINVNPGSAAIANSSITSSAGPVTADGVAAYTVSVTLKDAYNNPVSTTQPNLWATPTTSVTERGCGVTNGSGVATCTVKATKAEDKVLSISTPISLTGPTITFVPGPATQIAFSTQPSTTATAGTNFSINPVVQVQDANGNAVTSATGTVTLTSKTSDCAGNFVGTLTGSSTSVDGTTGNAAFSSVSFTKTGTLALWASYGSFTKCSNNITVSPNTPAKLAFSTQPSTQALIGKVWGTQPAVQILDTHDNVVPTANYPVTITAYDGSGSAPAAGTLTPTTNPVTASGGTATFAGVTYPREEFITVRATQGPLTPAISNQVELVRWNPLATSGAPTAREGHTSIWTNSKWLIWGGKTSSGYTNSGAMYDPATNTWTALPVDANTPSARGFHTAVWTGSEMIVWGGRDDTSRFNDGARYNPVTQVWTALPTTGAPTARTNHTAVWTSAAMIIWGGFDGSYLGNGASYSVASNTWTATQATLAPSARADHSAVWSGTEMLIFGGFNGSTYLNDGGAFAPSGAGSWSALQSTNAPVGRSLHTALWTGTQMLIWGGKSASTPLDTGALYSPASGGTWTATSTTGVPEARYRHSAVWTGSTMIIWGGTNGMQISSGGIYTPGGSWSTTSNGTLLPAAREGQAATWATDRMLLFGGCSAGSTGSCTSLAGDGALYLP